MGYWRRRELLTGAIGGACGAGVLGYSWTRYSTRREVIRLSPITLVNGSTEPQEVYVRIYTTDEYEFHDTFTLEAAETDTVNAEGSTTTRTLDGPWEATPRAYALTVVSSASLRDGQNGWPLTNEDIWEDIAEDDTDSECAEVSIYVDSSMLNVQVSASDSC